MDYYDYQSFVISNRDNLVKSTQGIHLLKAALMSPLTVRTTCVRRRANNGESASGN